MIHLSLGSKALRETMTNKELCRIMIDYHYQNKGYGTRAIKMILDEMMMNRSVKNETSKAD